MPLSPSQLRKHRETDEFMGQRSHLRVYYGPEDSRSVALTRVSDSGSTVDVPLHVLLDTLGEAARKKRAWVEDFQDEKITISADLYEVIAAYRQIKRPA